MSRQGRSLRPINGWEHAPPWLNSFLTPRYSCFHHLSIVEKDFGDRPKVWLFSLGFCWKKDSGNFFFPFRILKRKKENTRNPVFFFFFFFQEEFSPAPGRNPGLSLAFVANYFGDPPKSFPKSSEGACCHALMATVLRKRYICLGWNNIMRRYPKRAGRDRNYVIPEED